MDTNLGRVIGYDGKEIELSRDSLYIKWRYVGDTNWKNLISLNDLKVGLPKGGTTNQVLTKLSNNDWDYIWKTPEGGGGSFEDGIYHPKNGDELYDIFENEPGWSKIIDFSNFDYSSFYKDGYIIDGKAFTIRNFSMGSNWGARQFNWLKSPLFTLNNGATLYFQKLVIDISDIHHDAGDGQEAANNAPVIRVNNGSYVSIVDGGMININNVTGIDKYVAIELNNSNTNIQNFGIIINSYDMRRPSGIDSLTCGILCNGFSYGENNFDRVGFEINGNTTEKYGIKYNDDLGGFIKIHGCSFIVDDGNGYSIYCSNKTILELNFANVGKIDGMAITVKQLLPDTDYYKDDIIEINNKLYQVTQDFNSNDYNDIEDGYGQVYEDFWTINVTGTMYSIEDPNGRISSYETTDDGYRAKGLTLDTENWNLPISDQNLTSDNAQDAIKELASRESGGGFANLYDTKLLSQAITDKGWTYLCNSTKQMLPKAKIPTVYGDIYNKYSKVDKELSTFQHITINKGDLYRRFFYDKTTNKYYYLDNSNGFKIYKYDNPQLVNEQLVYQAESGVWGSSIVAGENIIVVYCGNITIDNIRKNRYAVFDKNFNFLRYVISDNPYRSTYNTYVCFYKKGILFFGYNLTRGDNDDIAIMDYIYDNIDVSNVHYVSNPFYQEFKNSDGFVGGSCCYTDLIDDKYVYILTNSRLNRQRIYRFVIENNNFIIENIGTYQSNAQANLFYFKNKFYLFNEYMSNESVYQSSDCSSFTYLRGVPFRNVKFSISFGDYCIICTDTTAYITYDMENFEIYEDNIGISYDTILNFVNEPSYFYMLGSNGSYTNFLGSTLVPKAYTDNYTINGTTVSIQYYKFEDWKICISDGGTNDTNLDTVYNGLGYENYWLLDLTNEQLCLPRNSNLYTQMYVGDDYEDSNLPAGNYSAVALKSEIEKLPDQTGQNGKYLKTNGTSTSWQDIELPSSMLQEAATVALTGDYSDLSNKPSINNITLSGNKSANDLGLQNQLTWTYTEITETLEVE